MGALDSLTARLVGVDSDRSLSSRFREARWQRFVATFPEIAEMRVLDIGGETEFWRRRRSRPARVTMVNPVRQDADEPWIESVEGDGCDLPGGLGEFDLAFSNSVIEHVGGHTRRHEFAEQVRAAAPRYWVQTPNRYFPIEPHFVFPFFQHLPTGAQARVAKVWPVGNYDGSGHDLATMRAYALEVELISRGDLELYFPEAEILHERLAGLSKSLIAVRR
ncbi:MAG TPA: class I SAM-dependent methyltransferase [Thermoleophilaceae bacterium]|nr:class I SAM-dependent methyltransferase [Thermoleophilaceae bacterium]